MQESTWDKYEEPLLGKPTTMTGGVVEQADEDRYAITCSDLENKYSLEQCSK
jgi:hypothetical protein